MTGRETNTREREGARDRESTLVAAILESSASLDLDTVLHKVVEGARGLTGARLGIIATVDESGTPGEYLLSGFTPEQERELVEWSDGLRLVEHLHELHGPLRVGDLPGYVRELGLTPLPTFPAAFQGTPVRHRGESVGYLYLAEKADGGAFSAADEEVLMLFASQAAAAIGNALAYRSEQRARMDLDALIETSPVGVVVFEGGSGRMESYNREARRIVESLRVPGRPLEELLKIIACRRADGREVSLAEFPLAQQFASAEIVRSEEVVLSAPHGPSVRTLINATPILANGPVPRSVVVTMQDLAPLDEIERMRTDFLGQVSHELRTPLTAIKGSAVTLLEEPTRLDSAEMREFLRVIVEQADQMRSLIADLLDSGRIDSGALLVSPEPTARRAGSEQPARERRPAHARVRRHPRRGSARRAACRDFGRRRRGRRRVRVAAAPVPQERRRGNSSRTASHGLGLAICRGLVEAHGGRIRAASDGPGQGTTITFTIPVAAEPGATAGVTADMRWSTEAVDRPRILVVDDDPRTLRFVRDTLTDAGYAPLMTGTPDDLMGLIRAERPQLVLLDLMLPGRDGIELLQEMPELSDLPVIFISGYGRDETIARALDLGADDYIVKPFSPTELVARIRAALRRRQEPETFVLGELAIHYESRQVTVGGAAVELTATEYELLRLLSINAGRVVHNDIILLKIWDGRDGAKANRVRIFVRTLRRKLGDSAENPTWIFNLRGVGYRMPRPGER